MIDPFPYVQFRGTHEGSRHAYPGTLNGFRLQYAPRAEYDQLTEDEFFDLKGWKR